MKYLIFTISLYHVTIFSVLGQMHDSAVPLSATENLPAISYYEDLPAINITQCKSEYPEEVIQFACPIYTDFDPYQSGEWTETQNGSIWRIGIQSKNAYSLYLKMIISLSPEAKLFIYAPGYHNLKGAFTSANNKSEVLTIAPIPGDQLIIELNLPDTVVHNFGELKIIKVYHDFLDIFKQSSIQGRQSNACDEDINCVNGSYWQTEKRSVCKIISNGGMGTGTLIGNTAGSNIPFVLTARHLISSEEIAAESLFLFNFESAGCGEGLASNSSSLSGANIVATTDHKVDFVLLKLKDTPPPSYQPFYAGWDAKNTNPQTGVCIHHPFGGPKQIAKEYHQIANEDIGQGFDANSTWKISHWEFGSTQPGSSGAPLFNENHRLVGTLSGGRSSCNYPKDDYFTKFSVAWDAYPHHLNQLKHWLDVDRTGQLVLDGYDPYGFNAGFCDTAWNISNHDLIGLSNTDLTWGWISGHSSAGYTQFAERFEAEGVLQINGVYLNVAKAFSSDPLAHIEVMVWEGDQYPEMEIFSKLVFIKNLEPNTVKYVAFDTVLSNSGPLFIGYKIKYSEPSDVFALYHAMDRGKARPSSMYIYRNSWYASEDPRAFDMATSLGIGISACYSKPTPPITTKINVYPNPASGSITLDLPNRLPIHKVICYDASGRLMAVQLEQNEAGNKLYFNLKPGIYIIKIITTEKAFSSRFVVR